MWWLILTSDWLLEPAIYKMSHLKSMSVSESNNSDSCIWASLLLMLLLLLLLRLCLDFTLHLTPSSLQWFWLPPLWFIKLRELSLINMRPSQEYPWQSWCPGRLLPAGGLHHYSYRRALTAAVVVVTGCRCGCCGRSLNSSQWALDSRDLTLTSVTSPEWAPRPVIQMYAYWWQWCSLISG